MKSLLSLFILSLMVFPLLLLAQDYTVYNSANSSLPYNRVYCIDYDRNGNIWFGGQEDAFGFARVSVLSRDLSSWTVYQPQDLLLGLTNLEDRVFYMAVDDRNTKWFCTHYGVSYRQADGTAGEVAFTNNLYTRTVQTDSKGNVYISVRATPREDSRIWVSEDHGANWTGWDLAAIGMSISMSTGRPEVYDLREDSGGQLWLCTWYGVTYRDIGGVWHSISSLEGEYTYAMTIDPNDHVWVPDYGTRDLYEILPSGTIVTHDSTTITPLRYLVEDIESDMNGHIWCATVGGGLVEIKPDLSYNQYTVASTGGLLPSDTLTHMEIKDNVIWASTATQGIVRLADFIQPIFVGITNHPRQAVVPETHALRQNFPNPFNPTTHIQFDLSETGAAQLAVYDVQGNLVRIITDSYLPAGSYQVSWDGKDRIGRPVASGVYFYRLRTDQQTISRKMMLLK